jgi:hypothetical protein
MKPERDNNFDDHLLDGCLEEILGGRTPPDLTARIMQAWAMRRQSGIDSDIVLPPLPGPPVETLPLEIAPLQTAVVRAVEPPPAHPTVQSPLAHSNGEFPPVRRKGSHRPRRSASTWPWWAAATCVAGLGLTLVMLANNSPKKPNGPVAKNGSKTEVVKPTHSGLAQNSPANNATPAKPAPPQPVPQGMGDDNRMIAQGNQNPKPMRPAVLPPEATPEVRPPKPAPNVHELVEKKYDQAASDAEVIAFINESLAAAWKANNVQPSPAASDEEWCRRVHLRLLGRIPTVDEVRSFVRDKSRDKREKLVAKLMESEQYADQFATHWANLWANHLVGRTLGGEAEQLASREGLELYLRDSLASRKPYYQIVYELLTAEGSAQPGSPDFNGAVNFLVASLGKDATLATARTSRVFLGQQLQCAQCHAHPTHDWTQHQYWALNAFFRQAKVERVAGITRLINEDFVNKKNVTTEGEVYFELPNGTIRATGPAFVDGTKIPASGRVDEVNRRHELAKLIVTSPQLSPALVNRMWSHYFGFGFTRPVDDIRKLMKWIVLSDAFGRSSRITPNNLADAPETGTVALFSHYYTRQMQAEEVYNSLLIAADLRKKATSPQDLVAARVDWLSQFNRPMGTDDSEEETHFNGALRQSLIMMNGDLMRRAVSSGDGTFLKHVQDSNMKPEEKIEHLFLAALSRPPSKRELEAVRKIAAQLPDNFNAVLEDIWWALLNSNEFILDH